VTYHAGIATQVSRAARAINAPRTVQEQLDVIVQVAAASMPEIDHAGISIAHRDGRIETRAANDKLVLTLDELQYTHREGPCVHAIDADPVTVVEYARHEQRWPAYIGPAVRLGLRSQLGMRLYIDDRTRGGLNLYSTSSDTIGEETRHLADLFAAQAALALGRVHDTENLNSALASRTTIGIALGLIMERYDMDQDQAFEYLTRIASSSQTKLREVAEHLIAEASAQHRNSAARSKDAR